MAPSGRQVDEDGFELVTYKRKARDLGPEKSAEPEKKKKKELTDFYKFQARAAHAMSHTHISAHNRPRSPPFALLPNWRGCAFCSGSR